MEIKQKTKMISLFDVIFKCNVQMIYDMINRNPNIDLFYIACDYYAHDEVSDEDESDIYIYNNKPKRETYNFNSTNYSDQAWEYIGNVKSLICEDAIEFTRDELIELIKE